MRANWRRIATSLLREVIALAAEEVERADRLRLVHQRHDDLRGHARHELDVARIGREIVDEERLLAGDRGANQALSELQPKRFVAVGIADGIGGLQLAAPLVEQIDGERFERDETADEQRNLREQIVEVENGCDLAAQIEERVDELVLGGVDLQSSVPAAFRLKIW